MNGFPLGQPSLRITSPAGGTTVHPGGSLTVIVDVAPAAAAFQLVSIVGSDPIGFSKEALTSPPYKFTVHIPEHIRPNAYTLTALGTTSPGHLVSSHPVEILVERSDSPISIIVYPTLADFTMEQKRYLQVTGRYADQTEADLSQSSRIKYVSSNPAIASVQAQGIVSPVAPGSTKITITYDGLKLEVPVQVRRSAR